ncbi:hypothetical protein EDB89DRAFT_2155898 [Lactarius sanguifluus]|nr:hypothetical protein EDB89DRAFT_2155898 [Lactarius sanguifluus]
MEAGSRAGCSKAGESHTKVKHDRLGPIAAIGISAFLLTRREWPHPRLWSVPLPPRNATPPLTVTGYGTEAPESSPFRFPSQLLDAQASASSSPAGTRPRCTAQKRTPSMDSAGTAATAPPPTPPQKHRSRVRADGHATRPLARDAGRIESRRPRDEDVPFTQYVDVVVQRDSSKNNYCTSETSWRRGTISSRDVFRETRPCRKVPAGELGATNLFQKALPVTSNRDDAEGAIEWLAHMEDQYIDGPAVVVQSTCGGGPEPSAVQVSILTEWQFRPTLEDCITYHGIPIPQGLRIHTLRVEFTSCRWDSRVWFVLATITNPHLTTTLSHTIYPISPEADLAVLNRLDLTL